MKSEKGISLEVRCCDVCDSCDLEPLWSYHRRVSTHNYFWRFEVNNKICRNCGFVFVSPVYSPGDLAEYYNDSYPNFGNGDFDSAARIAFIESLVPPPSPATQSTRSRAVFLEIGSNSIGIFQEYLSGKYQYNCVEPNASTTKTYESTASIESESVDIVAHYFVLEHVVRPFEFMREAYRVLKAGGVMVCEVPDISIYASNPSALMLHEHVNHFSRGALIELAERAGFQLIRTEDACSRSFGFAVAFIKGGAEHVKLDPPKRDMYLLNKFLFERGMDLVRKYESNLLGALRCFQGYMSSSDKVVLWVANSIAKDFIDLLGANPDEELVRVVDSNPKKQKFFDSFSVFTPHQVDAFINEAHAIFIFSEHYASEILEDIHVRFDKTFDADHTHILSLPNSPVIGGDQLLRNAK